MSVALHGDQAKEKEVVLDTTALEKAITFPTDAKLHTKIVQTARRAARKVKTIAGRLVRELERKLPTGHRRGERLT